MNPNRLVAALGAGLAVAAPTPDSGSLGFGTVNARAATGRAENCSKSYLGTHTACVHEFENRWNSPAYDASMASAACLPSAVDTEPVYGLANSWTLQPESSFQN